MAEGEDRVRSRSASEHSLQNLDTHSTTKQEAIDNLEHIIRCNENADEELDENAKKLLKTLTKSDQKPGDLLTSVDRTEFIKIVKTFKTLNKSVVEVTKFLHILEVMQQFRLPAIRNDERHAIIVIEEQLTSTKAKLHGAQEKIDNLNQEITQMRSKQSSERDMFEKELSSIREEKQRQRQFFEEEIRTLNATIRQLEEDKRALGNQIKDLQNEVKEEKAVNEKYRQEQKELLEKVSQNNLKEIRTLGKEQDEKLEEVNKTHAQGMRKLQGDVDQLMEENRKLKTRDPYKLVGYGVTLITNALYKHVHNPQQLRKNYYSIDDLESQLEGRGGDGDGGAARQRWATIRETLRWTARTKALLTQLAENRERGVRRLDVSLSYGDFSEAVLVMYDQNELDESEMNLVKDLFSQCSNLDL